MKAPYPMMICLVFALLTGCTTTSPIPPSQQAMNYINRQNVVTTTSETYPAKKSQTVAIYTKKNPSTPYRVIGVATVSKYNLMGRERKENMMQDRLKSLAASIGGDGLINVSKNNDNIQAKVIAFQNILL